MTKSSTSSPSYRAVIVHGWAVDPNNEQKWQTFRELFTKETGIPTTFLELPGLSSELKEVWTLDDYVTWVHKKITAKDSTAKVLYIGHSFGGQIGMRLAVLYPETVTKFALLDSSGIRDQSLSAKVKRGVFFGLAKVGKLVTGSLALRKVLYKLARAQDYHAAPPLLRKTMDNVVSQEVRSDLPNIKNEVALIWGAKDHVTPLWMGQYFAANLRNSKFYIIDNARHSPQFTHPAEVVQILERWLKDSK